MSTSDEAPRARGESRTWEERVVYSPDGRFAYRPREVLVPAEQAEEARRIIEASFGTEVATASEPIAGFVLLRGNFPPLPVVEELRAARITAVPNHVYFAHCSGGCSGCCPPHPSLWAGCSASGHATWPGSGYAGWSAHGDPFSSNPFSSNPFSSNPSDFGLAGATPAEWWARTGRRRSSARPAPEPQPADAEPESDPAGAAVVVLDTGLVPPPPALLPAAWLADRNDVADDDGDTFLDPVAGHGTFIAGLIARYAASCTVRVRGIVSNLGDTDECTVADALQRLYGDVDFVNMSFSSYSPLATEGPVAAAVRRLQREPSPAGRRSNVARVEQGAVVVASAGNDGTCLPTYPGALQGVVSVGAIGPSGPAPFTNYGRWVRACAPGVDLVSTFFSGFNGPDVAVPGQPDPDRFDGWARWSGTSFSAPVVVACLARLVYRTGCSPLQAVARLIDAPGLGALPWLGTVVNP
jgi:Subtilase family